MIKGILHSLLLATAMFASTPCMAQQVEKTPAFPGAEGFGRYTTGGRGGKVIHVTNLNDSGEGSFRAACSEAGARTIVFDVAGTIHLETPLELENGNVTIAGQTAPGDGICIADNPFQIEANNVIIRYMRFRLGNKYVTEKNADGWDGLGGMDKENIMVDHCSVSWSIDECLSIYGVRNATVQWCIAAQSLQASGHSKGAHGYGGNWGGSGVTYHHNLLAHHESRVPRLGPRYTTQLDERLDMRNNVFYNWAGNGCYGGEAMNVNIVNNYYKPGPGTAKRDAKTIQRRIAAIGVRTNEYIAEYPDYKPTLHKWGTFYIDGNVNSKYDDVTKDNWTYGVYNQTKNDDKVDYTYTDEVKKQMKLDEPIEFVHVTTHSANDAYDRVIKYAGCSKVRDSYDKFIIDDTENGKATYTGKGYEDNKGKHNNNPGMINSPEDNRPDNAPADWSPWPELTYEQSEVQPDTDGDGMPDGYETANGLDPNNPEDGAEDSGNGYTNLEIYLNSLVAGITEGQLAGGEVMGEDRYVGEEPVATEYELSPQTYDYTDENGDWLFTNGFSITTSKTKADGSGCGISGIKYSRNEDYTINIPNGIKITKISITGYSNGKNGETAYLSELDNETFTADEYVFPSRNGNTSVTHTIALVQEATESLHFRIAGSECVWIITLYPETSTGITNVNSEEKSGNGKTYNLQGMEVKEPLAPGIYIRDGKKFIKKR